MTELYLCKCISLKDNECSTYEDWSEPIPFTGEVWPASGNVQVQQYGSRLNYIQNLRIDGKYEKRYDGKRMSYDFGDGKIFAENDGICVYTNDKPDYRIVSIKAYHPILMELEKI